jgi:hypothetical protein
MCSLTRERLKGGRGKPGVCPPLDILKKKKLGLKNEEKISKLTPKIIMF